MARFHDFFSPCKYTDTTEIHRSRYCLFSFKVRWTVFMYFFSSFADTFIFYSCICFYSTPCEWECVCMYVCWIIILKGQQVFAHMDGQTGGEWSLPPHPPSCCTNTHTHTQAFIICPTAMLSISVS